MHVFKLVLVITTFLLFPQSLQSSEEIELDDPYNLDLEFRKAWDTAGTEANKDPKLALAQLEQEYSQIPKAELRRKVYAKLTLIGLKLTIEMSPEALEDIHSIEQTVASLPEPIYQARLLQEKSRAAMNMGNYQDALNSIQSSIKIYQSLGLLYEQVRAIQNRGQVYIMQGNYDLALKDYFFGYEQFKILDKKAELAGTVAAIAQVYHQTGDKQKAIEYYKEVLELINLDEKKLYASIIYYNLAKSYQSINEEIQARDYFQKALDLSIELGDEIGQAYVYRELGTIAANFQNYIPAIKYYRKAKALGEKAKDLRLVAIINMNLANVYSLNAQHNEALAALQTALSEVKALNAPELTKKANFIASQVYERQGDMTLALSHHKSYTALLEDVLKEDRQKTLNEMKVKFDSERKTAENLALQSRNELAQIELEKKNLYQNFLIIIIAMAALVFVIIFLALWQQTKAREKFKNLALTDELTKAPNRRSILEHAHQKIRQTNDGENMLLVALLDLDHFKNINDNYGHKTGDTVLIEFYKRCTSVLRQSDHMGRVGGEEWLLVISESNLEKVAEIFQRMREVLNAEPIDGLPRDIKLTFSMGVTAYKSNDHLEGMIKRADAALYQAKEKGRDCWELAP